MTQIPKRPFREAVADIVALHGTKISRKNLHAYCTKNNILIPAVLYSQHRLPGVRGWFDLTVLLQNAQGTNTQFLPAVPPPPEMTDEEIEVDLSAKFSTLELMSHGVVDQSFRSLIVSGNPGIGKTFTLENIFEKAAGESKILFTGVRGYVRATGLYRLMWENRHKEAVLLFDDSDFIFTDEISLNLLKGGLDTTKKRKISWHSEKVFESEDGENIPQEFEFNGAVVFISNLNFPRLVAQGSKLAPHLAALMDRSFYLDLNLNSVREQLIRIKWVAKHSDILKDVDKKGKEEILEYIKTNQERFRELSLRSLVKLQILYKGSKGNISQFKRMASATLLIRR
jgi:hypothetical protein